MPPHDANPLNQSNQIIEAGDQRDLRLNHCQGVITGSWENQGSMGVSLRSQSAQSELPGKATGLMKREICCETSEPVSYKKHRDQSETIGFRPHVSAQALSLLCAVRDHQEFQGQL